MSVHFGSVENVDLTLHFMTWRLRLIAALSILLTGRFEVRAVEVEDPRS